ILFVRESTGERGATGYYMLTDWGILDRSSFLNRYGKL
ncbi:helix-turn-helix domain-containing protein, partial [Salmonella enterica subsp. enterica serovar Dublin]